MRHYTPCTRASVLTLCVYVSYSSSNAFAFVPNQHYSLHSAARANSHMSSIVRANMVGGKGWENNSFLDSLGGSDEDQEKEKANYYEQQESRKAFNKRQEERMNNPAARKFMEDYARAQQEQRPDDYVQDIMGGGGGVGGFDDRFVADGEASATSSGGTRLQGMLAQAKRRQEVRGPPGLEEKFAIPLDELGVGNGDDDLVGSGNT